MLTVKIWLWNYCDYALPFKPKRFKIAAYLLHRLGCNYWFNSLDYWAA